MSLRELLRRRAVQLTAVALAALAAGFVGGRLLARPAAAGPAEHSAVYALDQGRVEEGFQTMSDVQAAFRETARKVLPAVVEVDVTEQGLGSAVQGLGSGVIVKSLGGTVYVLTNDHVVGEAETIRVRLSDGRSFPATLVGKDANRDLALVSFDSREAVPVAELGDSDGLQVGDWVLAVGNPLGFHSTVTEGIVSALGRESLPGSGVAAFTDYIQTDAAINEGNSGGPLVDVRGQVVGISTWIASPSGGSVGLGFAIPINDARRSIGELIATGKVSYGWLGVGTGALPEQDALQLYGAPVRGAFVQGIYRDSPAARAGLQPGDTIESVNGEAIGDSGELMLAVANLQPGDRASFGVRRESRQLQLSTSIGERGDEQAVEQRAAAFWPGLAVVGISDAVRGQLDLPRASGDLIVSSVADGSPADVAGLQVGDIVQEIGGRPARRLADFYRAVSPPEARELALTVTRQGRTLRVGLLR